MFTNRVNPSAVKGGEGKQDRLLCKLATAEKTLTRLINHSD